MRKETLNRISGLLLIAGILIFLAVIMFRTITRDKPVYSYYENRNLAQMPEWTVQGVIDGTWFSQLETYAQEQSALRQVFLRLNTYLDLHVLHRVVVNDVVVAGDVLLPYLEYSQADEAEILAGADAVARRLAAYSQQCESYGGKFYYVAVPCQYVLFEDEYPDYLNNREEHTRLSSQALFGRLEALGVDYIDMLQVFREMGAERQFGSAVDNHFSMQGAYETYLRIMERVNADTGAGLEVLTEGEYTLDRVPNDYLGSRERKLFDLWPSEEALYTITPNRSVPFTRYDWSSTATSASSVYQIPDAGTEVLYGMYMGGDIPRTVIETDRSGLPDILIYGDSFTNPVECIIWSSFGRMDSLDFRYYDEMTLSQYIDEYRPDVVVCIRDYEAMLSTSGNGA